MSELVSVIIPTHNRPQFVTEAIDSVLCQTYPNIELIVVNDGSTDDTEEKLQPYMHRMIYIRKENGGVSSAINAGLRAAKGKYIARLDDDDLFMPDKVEKQVEVLEDRPDVGLVTSGCFITDSIGRTILVMEAPNFSEYGPLVTLLLQHSLIFQPTVMVRRECHDKVGFYKNTFAEDLDMFLRISRYWKVGVIDQPLAKCRRHSGNMTAMVTESHWQDVANLVCDILDDVPLTELFPAIGFTWDPCRASYAYAARGSVYLHRKIFHRADADFRMALNLCTGSSAPLLWLGISARSQGRFQLAEEYFMGIQENDELYPMAQDARDLITVIRRNQDEDSLLLESEILKEHRRLFEITFDGISGKSAERISTHGSATPGLKLSRYAVIIDNYPESGKHLIFNTLTHAMVNIGDDLKDLIHSLDRPVGEDTLKDIRMLKKLGILVSQGFDETEIARKWYNTSKVDMSRVHATVLTTYNCNFACKYCIEEGVKKPVSMSDECSDTLVDWLMNRAEQNDTKQILLSFYGGEPLLNARPIYRISEKLQNHAVDKGIFMSSSIITNGSLINSQLLQDLTKYGLTAVKITIDGERRIHNARRPFKSGKGSFDTIVENIWKIPNTVKVTIQTNLDSENMDDFPRLLDFFERSGLKDRIDNLSISPIYQSLGLTPMPAGQGTDCMNLSDSQVADDLIYMRELAVKRGLKSQSDSIDYTICSMNRNGAVILIDPLGAVYSCPAFAGRQGFSIGDIYHAELSRGEELPTTQLEEGCFQCTYFPICAGGCRYTAYVLYGDHTRICCEREVVEHQTKRLIKLRYDQKAKQRNIA